MSAARGALPDRWMATAASVGSALPLTFTHGLFTGKEEQREGLGVALHREQVA